MGDDELNFTDEEARCWADDPRNQAQNADARLAVVVACLLVLIALLAIAFVNNPGGSTSRGGETQVGQVQVQ